jgi:hypothetical protein
MQKCSNSRGFRFSAGKRTSAHRGDEAPEERLNRSELVYSVDRSRAEKLRALEERSVETTPICGRRRQLRSNSSALGCSWPVYRVLPRWHFAHALLSLDKIWMIRSAASASSCQASAEDWSPAFLAISASSRRYEMVRKP